MLIENSSVRLWFYSTELSQTFFYYFGALLLVVYVLREEKNSWSIN